MATNTISNVCPSPNNGPGFSGGLVFQGDNIVPVNPEVVPIPPTMLLLGSGLVGMVAFRLRRGAKKA